MVRWCEGVRVRGYEDVVTLLDVTLLNVTPRREGDIDESE